MYDPMMDTDLYWRVSNQLRRDGWEGAGNRWRDPLTGCYRTLEGAAQTAFLRGFPRRLNEAMVELGRQMRPQIEAINEAARKFGEAANDPRNYDSGRRDRV